MTAALYALAALGTLASFLANPGKTRAALKKGWKAFENIMPQMLFVLTLIGIVLAFLTPDRITALIGEESGWKGLAIVLAIGSVTLIPPYVSYPLAATLLASGAGHTQIAGFISALTMVGVVTMPMEMQYFGPRGTLLRNGLCLIHSVFVALAMERLLG